jgi:hypothetical protein
VNETATSITVDDLRAKALRISDMAQREVRSVAEEQTTRVALIGLVAIVAAVSIAYYLGSRRR